MSVRGPKTPGSEPLKRARAKDGAATAKSSDVGAKVRADELPAEPQAAQDVYGGVGERLQIAARNWDPTGSKKLGDELHKLALDARALSDHIDAGEHAFPIARGVGSGVVVGDAAAAARAKESGTAYVLVVKDFSPPLLEAAADAAALIVVGRKSEAARITAALGKPAVRATLAQVNALGSVVTVDGSSGKLAAGNVAVVKGTPSAQAASGIDQLKKKFALTVTALASTPEKIAEARMLGADRVRIDGTALIAGTRPLANVRRYLLETEAAPRKHALENVVTLAKTEAKKLLDAAGSTSTSFVLGDTAPHALFPSSRESLDALAKDMGLPPQLVRDRVGDLGAGNSKLGLRGARWAVKDPDLFAGFARAIFEAYADEIEAGKKPGPLRIQIPNVALGGEMELVKRRLERERKAVEDEYGLAVPVSYAAGIDTARGALSTDEISQHVDALDYGAGELTETLYAISRDDAEQYLPKMLEGKLLPADPFAAMDVDAVGKMIRVGQYLAGEKANAFPASLSGPQALTANGMFAASQGGVREVVVPASAALTARMLDARVQFAIDATRGAFVPSSSLRDTPTKLFELLVSRGDNKVTGGTQKLAPGVTALEHVEELQHKVESGALTSAQALLAVPPDIVDQLSKPVVDPKAEVTALSKGIAASPGCGQGRVAFSKEAAADFAAAGEPYVLIVNEVHADEVEATRKAAGLVSVRGGKTSHAAMIAGNSDVPCVMDEKVQINLENKTAAVGRTKVGEGDWITIDGTKGQILAGKVPLLNPTKSTAFASLMKWADEHRTLDVLANADTPSEAATAFARGAQGVGLVRSEHMFYEADRLLAFRAVILSDVGARPAQMAELEKAQVDDYTALFSAAGEKKVAVRLLDPPLYEFLPTKPDEIKDLARSLAMKPEALAHKISGAQEIDSMLGMRGVRLALARPDIEAMQVRALAKAWVSASEGGAKNIAPLHIIVPQVSAATEMVAAKERIEKIVADVATESGVDKIPVKLGSMIETPRAALEAAAIGKVVDFFSYGTNDLTQGTLGYGRNVAAKFIPELIKSKALTGDPTESLDDKGVVKLMRVAETLGKDENPSLYGGVCGGQAGDPSSIDSVQAAGLKYISVSPGQVAKARLAAGQAAVKQENAAKSSSSESGIDARIAQSRGDLSRALAGITRLPTGVNDKELVDLCELALRNANRLARTVLRESDVDTDAPASGETLTKAAPLLKLITEAREILDANRLAGALASEAVDLRSDVQKNRALLGPKLAAALASVDEAQHAADAFAQSATDAIGKARSSGGERDIASHAWAALRAFEGARQALIDAGALPAAHQFHARLWHHNDGWDNQHYTNAGPQSGENMIAFMKRAAHEFIDDNNVSVSLQGTPLESLPTDRPIILAVAHRSGAIDRFVTMGALPLKDDELQYVVRKDSPYDLIAKKSFAAKDNPILAPESAGDLIASAKDGFTHGKRFLLTYPQGTGTIAGESRYAASSIVRLAQETGALIVPVTTTDSYDTRPYDGSQVTVHVHAPIDPLAVGSADVTHTALNYELTSGYRAKL